MSGDGLTSATRFLVLALSALYALAAVAGLALLDFDTTGNSVVWFTLLGIGVALMLVGQLAAPAGWLSALLVSVGAAVGGLPLVWTVIVPIAVATVIACSIAVARRRISVPAG
ncbi:MAG: hypothetical protein ACRDPV_10835 [Gaiellaceae bacterium]